MIILNANDPLELSVSDPETGLQLKARPMLCDNPDCASLHFSFEENGERIESGRFSITVDMDSWQEISPSMRPDRARQIIESFLSQLPEETKNVYQSFLDRKCAPKRLAEHCLSREDLKEGWLVSYLGIISKNGSLYNSGTAYEYLVHHKGTDFLVEDLYCPNPKCECREAVLIFFENDQESATVTERTSINVRFDGSIGSHQSHPDSAGLIGALRAQHPDFPVTLKSRYREIKKVAARSLAEYRKEDRQALNDSKAIGKIGRNDSCPCGSGKKYKKCCMKTTGLKLARTDEPDANATPF